MTPRDPLHVQARDLPREIEPPRDLWPGIAARLDAVDREPAASSTSPDPRSWQRRLTRHPAAAAAVLVAATLAVALITADDNAGPAERADASTLATLEDVYAAVRADLVSVLDTRCDHWPEGACEGLRTGLSELDQTAHELRAALRQTPPGSGAARQLTLRYQHTLEQARGLAGRAVRL